MRLFLLPCMIWVFVSLAGPACGEDKSRLLFDGKSLSGWVQHGGKATYRVEDGMIVGRSAPNTSNSFLCTVGHFGDFVLTYEFKCDAELNSGVQIRSNVFDADTEVLVDGKAKKIGKGRVHGYQVEIDPNQPERLWTAGIYDEGRRGWLFPGGRGGDGESFTKQGQRLYNKGDWNRVRVECRGDRIRTWLNGELRADFEDSMTSSGFVGLQVHGVGDRTDTLTVRWRDLQIDKLQK